MPFRLPTFQVKILLTLGLVVLADALLFGREPGAGFALVGLALAGALLAANPGVERSRLALGALIAAAAFAALQAERPTAVGCLLYVVCIGVAALAPRASAGDDALQWGQRLLAAGLKAVPGPFLDLRRLLAAGRRRRPVRLVALALAAALPVVGGLVFLSLFSVANPLIAEALSGVRLPALRPDRVVFWGLAGFVAWTALRPRGLRRRPARSHKAADLGLPGVTARSVAVSLVVFNLLFALQNGLDLAFLWSGAELPRGMSYAAYAHQGAYPLIATALLAGLFVLVFLRPGSPTSASRPIRLLVTLWVLQNVFLVASTALRTLAYVDAYSLTRLRIAALLWMALVAVGLILVLWRLLKAKSAGWLVGANAAAAGVVLVLCSLFDLGAVAAHWNVRHAREVGGRGVELDLCYLRELNGAALVSLAEFEQRPLPPDLLDAVRLQRMQIRADMERRQSDWRAWRWRDARRLARDARLPSTAPQELRACHRQPVRPLAAPPAPLTAPPNPRS